MTARSNQRRDATRSTLCDCPSCLRPDVAIGLEMPHACADEAAMLRCRRCEAEIAMALWAREREPVVCAHCDEAVERRWSYDVQVGRDTERWCEDCAERAYQRNIERLMEGI